MTSAARVENAQELADALPPQTSAATVETDRKPDGTECACPALAEAHVHDGEKVLLIYRFQPKDEQGRPLGGAQVIRYETPQDLADKLAEQNSKLIRLNRELKWNSDKPIEGDVPADAPRTTAKLKPRALDQAERVTISQQLMDPEQMDQAAVRLFEAVYGMKPETLQQIHDNLDAMRGYQEGQVWVKNNPSFYVCPENVTKLHKWCADRDLLAVQKNFDLAFQKLKEAGLLLEAPIAAEETRANTQPAVRTEESRIALPDVTLPPTRTPSTSSGLTRSQTSGGGAPAGKRGLTWADVDRMPQAEYDQKLRTDAAFRQAVDALPQR